MDQHALEILDFPRVLTELAGLCRSPAGTALLHGQEFALTDAAVDAWLEPAVQLRQLVNDRLVEVGIDLPDVADALLIIEKVGTALEPEAAARIGRFLRSARALTQQVRTLAEVAAGELLQPLLAAVADFAAPVRDVFRIVTDTGELRESDIPELAAIRRRIHKLQANVAAATQRYLAANEYRDIVNGDRATERDGRTVLPIHVKHRARVPGIVHEVSGSGATLFIEPQDIVDTNNRIVEEQYAYQREVLRIMRRLTGMLHERYGEIADAVAAVAFFDTIIARAEYARRHDCAPCRRHARAIMLNGARHPVLGDAAVPIDIGLGAAGRALIITGPNTGGKTAALKTLGLLALMNQFGVEIPATAGSIMPVFDQVLADIGDEQSLDQSLSTFSGHVRRQAAIAETATARSLVLLDELGAGTDPEEGSALAMALLDHLLQAGAQIAATTHHGALKNYGYVNQTVENAAVEFDLKTLSPTYRILLGVPGESHALEIARRHGMVASVMAAADAYLAGARTDAAALMRTLIEREQELRLRVEQHAAAAGELALRLAAQDQQAAALDRREQELRDQGLQELRQLLSESRRDVEGAVRAVREAGRPLEPTAQAAARQTVAQLEGHVADVAAQAATGRTAAPASESGQVAVGARVLVRVTGVEGAVIRAGRRGTWIVAAGNVRGTFAAEELQLLPPDESARAGRGAGRAGRPGSGARVSTQVELVDGGAPALELNVRGMRLADALSMVEKQLDHAIIAGLQQFSILHGKGEGILRSGIQKYLADSTSVARVYSPPAHEGGDGKTTVELR
jgi:DNA mismatch repair protein MutS2